MAGWVDVVVTSLHTITYLVRMSLLITIGRMTTHRQPTSPDHWNFLAPISVSCVKYSLLVILSPAGTGDGGLGGRGGDIASHNNISGPNVNINTNKPGNNTPATNKPSDPSLDELRHQLQLLVFLIAGTVPIYCAPCCYVRDRATEAFRPITRSLQNSTSCILSALTLCATSPCA